jgi:hypothetical protein
MRKLTTALVATAAILVAGSIAWKAEATTLNGAGALAPLAKNYSPAENIGCVCGPYRCACGHPYYAPYAPRYGYYGYGYRPYGYGYRYRY